MAGYPFPNMPRTAGSSSESARLGHSTSSDVRVHFNSILVSAWDQHQLDISDSHAWLDGFLDNMVNTAKARQGGIKPAIEMMKTPSRRRAKLNDSNASINKNLAVKDPIATLLFPAAVSPRNNKENDLASGRSILSPVASLSDKAKGKSKAVTTNSILSPPPRSPMRAVSPRSAASKPKTISPSLPQAAEESLLNQAMEIDFGDEVEEIEILPLKKNSADAAIQSTKQISVGPQPQPPPESAADEEEEAMDEDEEEDDIIAANVSTASTTEALGAELSMIGEESEGEEEILSNSKKRISPPAPVNVPESQPAQPDLISPTPALAPLPNASPFTALGLGASSPQSRVVSGASSIAAEADADTTAPLNDAPSNLRNNVNALASSLPASAQQANSTRTPGGSSNTLRFGAGTFSAAKVGAVGIGSSPPTVPAQASQANIPPTTTAAGMRASTGGARQLNFVGLPKKSLGLGLGFGRTWNGGRDSVQGTSGTQTAATANALKRKSLTADDVPNKASRTTEDDVHQPKTKFEELRERMKTLQSTATAARTSGINGAVTASRAIVTTAYPTTSTSAVHAPISAVTPVVAPNSIEMNFAPVPASIASAFGSAPITAKPPVNTSAAESAPVLDSSAVPSIVRRPSVMERVKSFEQTSTTQEIRPVSPSKLGGQTNSLYSRVPTSPRLGAFSPKSPRTGFSPSNFSSPNKFASMTATASKIPTPASPVPATRIALPSSPVVQPKSPARKAANPQSTLSTTPKDSPKTKLQPIAATRSILQQLGNDATEEIEQERPVSQPAVKEATIARQEEAALSLDEIEREANLVSLPPRPEMNLSEELDEEGFLIEKDRAALVGAFEAVQIEANITQTSVAVEAHSASQFKPSLNKKISQTSIASSYSSQQSNGSNQTFHSFTGKTSTATASTTTHAKLSTLTASGKVPALEAAKRAKAKEMEETRKKQERVQQNRELAEKKKFGHNYQQEMEKKRVMATNQNTSSSSSSAKLFKPKIGTETTKNRVEIKKPQQMKPTNNPSTFSLNSSQGRSHTQNPALSQSNSSKSTLTASQGKMAPPSNSNALKNSTNSMVGVKFMSSAVNASAGIPARVQALNGSTHGKQALPTKKVAVPEPEPYQELPDIDSEYSDSGDEGREEKLRALPAWAQSPALADALYRQQHVNPDEVFGPIPPLQMHEIFRTQSTRLTKRTSSACWEGTDALTADDLARYNQAMGWAKPTA